MSVFLDVYFLYYLCGRQLVSGCYNTTLVENSCETFWEAYNGEVARCGAGGDRIAKEN